MRMKALLLASLFLLSLFALAQGKSEMKSMGGKSAAAPDKAFMQKIFDAWTTLDTDKVAPYYDHAPNDVFYDIMPLKYTGWAEYAAGIKPFFETVTSAKGIVNDDAAVHTQGNWAWGDATVKFTYTEKTGKTTNLDCRWTVVWEKKGGNWVIVHDHFSAPLPMEMPPKP